MNPTSATTIREFIDPKTGQVWTLTYTRGSMGHTVRCDPPFGELCSRPTHTTDIQHARRMWKLIQSNLTRRNGLVPV